MKTLYVYADFDWIEETELVGELGYESLRSSDCYCFTLNDGCFEKNTEICFLSDDLNNYQGQQYTQSEK